MKKLFYLIVVLILCSFSDPYDIKRVSDKDFRYEFYTTDKVVKPKEKKTYFWFKGGQIHSAQSGVFGQLLHGNYTKTYHSNQLAEQGTFRNGLKIGLWKTWHENGKIESVQYWHQGLKNGTYRRYNKDGILVETGAYRNDLERGIWRNYETKEKIKYRKGVIRKEKIKLTRADRKKLREEKKTAKIKEKEDRKIQKAEAEKAKKEKKAAEKNQPKKDGFFKRLFTKKEKKIKSDGTGA